MPNEEWSKTLNDGRLVNFCYQDFPEDGTVIAARFESLVLGRRCPVIRLIFECTSIPTLATILFGPGVGVEWNPTR